MIRHPGMVKVLGTSNTPSPLPRVSISNVLMAFVPLARMAPLLMVRLSATLLAARDPELLNVSELNVRLPGVLKVLVLV